jgi:hypothetical protein
VILGYSTKKITRTDPETGEVIEDRLVRYPVLSVFDISQCGPDGPAPADPVLRTEGRVTLIDGLLAGAVLLGLALNAGLGWWWADPVAGYVLVFYAGREVREVFFGEH